MIRPTDAELLAGVAEALKETVLPELSRGTAARKQLQAAIEILRRVAFALPGAAATLATDNEDMAEAIARIEVLLFEHSPPPGLPHQGGGMRSGKPSPLMEEGFGGGDGPVQRSLALQARLAELQEVPGEKRAQIDTLLTALYSRMTDRAMAQLPPPVPRTPRKPA